MSFLYRRIDDSVHFKVFGFPSRDYDIVNLAETAAVRSERVRLWYVALTRARDLLLMPKQSERMPNDWLSLVNLDVDTLPIFDAARFQGGAPPTLPSSGNSQDASTWQKQAATIAAAERRIIWNQPSRQEQPLAPLKLSDEAFAGADSLEASVPLAINEMVIQGGRERGVILHKMMEEVLTGETGDDITALQSRATELLGQLGLPDEADAAKGLSSHELATAVQRTLQLQEIVDLRPALLPEFRVYAATDADQKLSLTAGVADAIAYKSGRIQTVVDWKSDVHPMPADIEMYRGQVREYLAATGADLGLIVFLTSGHIERVQSPAGPR